MFVFFDNSKMHRLTQIVKIIQGPSFGLCSSYFHCYQPIHASGGNFSTYTGNTSHFTRLPVEELVLGYKPHIAKRQYLPGSSSGRFPEFLPGPSSSFPMAYKVTMPQEFDITTWSHTCRDLIDAELAVYGALLIR